MNGNHHFPLWFLDYLKKPVNWLELDEPPMSVGNFPDACGKPLGIVCAHKPPTYTM